MEVVISNQFYAVYYEAIFFHFWDIGHLNNFIYKSYLCNKILKNIYFVYILPSAEYETAWTYHFIFYKMAKFQNVKFLSHTEVCSFCFLNTYSRRFLFRLFQKHTSLRYNVINFNWIKSTQDYVLCVILSDTACPPPCTFRDITAPSLFSDCLDSLSRCLSLIKASCFRESRRSCLYSTTLT